PCRGGASLSSCLIVGRKYWKKYQSHFETLAECLDMEGEEGQDDFRARPYQEVLMNQAKKRNSIIYLPTGSGKTYIAVMLIKELSGALELGKHTFFMVNTVALVNQQAEYIKRHTHYSVGEYSVVKLQNVNLLIFDECHHAVNDQPMRQVMQHFERCPIQQQPRVLGLTATLLNKNCSAVKVANEVKKLETTFQSTVATCENMDEVCFFATNPIELTVTFKEGCSTVGHIEQQARNWLNKTIQFINDIAFENKKVCSPGHAPANLKVLDDSCNKENKKLRNLLTDVIFHIDTLGMFGGSRACLAHIIQVERLRRKSEDMLTKQVKLFEDEMSDCTLSTQIRNYSSYKVLTLIEIIKKYVPPDIAISPEDADCNTDSLQRKKEKFCTLVFVERRFTAKELCKVDADFQHISPDFIVGFNYNPFNDTREGALRRNWCYDCLNRFQTGEKNLLVASNVLEEGMDIQKCNLVVKFDLPLNYRSYVQSKGRARHRTSHYILMVPSNDNTFMSKYEEYKATEKAIERLLVGRTEEREGPSEELIAKTLYDQLVPPYRTSKSSVNLVSAIPLLHRYCNMLPQDKFTMMQWHLLLVPCASIQ
ncbi:hypothetical protein C0J52_01793, partial [Blattella germanica]